MTDFGSWMQDNWYQLGSFFVQCGFLFLAFWFAGKILRTLRASQEQVGALLKLTVGSAPTLDRHSDSPFRLASEQSPYWLPPTPSQPTTAFVTAKDNPFQPQSGPSHSGFVEWLKGPMGITAGTSSFHRVLRWFQSPAHT